MANFDPYFQDTMASTALENGRRGRIIAASRTAQRANNPHNSSQTIQSQHSSTLALQSVFLRRPSLDLFEGFFKFAFQIPNLKAHSPRAVQGGDADHDQIQHLFRRRFIRMIV
jgi:hypothetical protein